MQMIFTRNFGPTNTKPGGIVATHTGKATFVRVHTSDRDMAGHAYAASLLYSKLGWRGAMRHVGTDDQGRECWAFEAGGGLVFGA